MNEQQERALAAGLRALAATTGSVSASTGVENAVLAEMRRLTAVKPEPRGRGWLAVAAALILASSAGVWLATQAPRSGITQGRSIEPSGFTAVPGAAALPPMESGAIVRIALPVTALPSYGIQIDPDIRTYSVEADLLVAQDGVTRAVRLVNGSDTPGSTP